jgi:hypothetical protein
VRWAKKAEVRIEFDVSEEDDFEAIALSMSFRPQARPSAIMKVKFNGLEIKKYDITGWDNWHDDDLTFVPHRGPNLIEVLFVDIAGAPHPKDSLYMLFRKLSLSGVRNC